MIHSPFSFASPTSLLASGSIILNPKIHAIEIVILMVTSQHHPTSSPLLSMVGSPPVSSPWISKKKGQCPIAPEEAAGKKTWAHFGDKVQLWPFTSYNWL
jgi:hypothetical protein